MSEDCENNQTEAPKIEERPQLTDKQIQFAKDSFKIFDKDGSGSITLEELQLALKTMGLSPT